MTAPTRTGLFIHGLWLHAASWPPAAHIQAQEIENW
jgi:hypothetical protein